MLMLGFGVGYFAFANQTKVTYTSDYSNSKTTRTQNDAQPTSSVTSTQSINTQTSPSQKATYAVHINTSLLNAIQYKIPSGWTANINGDSLVLSPSVYSGHIAITAYDFPSNVSRREFFCKSINGCDAKVQFTETKIGNISGYSTDDIFGGGHMHYFGASGNKFYAIFVFNPPDTDTFDSNLQSVLDSLVF